MTPRFRREGEDLVFKVQVSPRASGDAIRSWHGDALKVRVAAPPSGGRANERLLSVLADAFGVPTSSVSLEAGAGHRLKRVRVASPRRYPECFRNAVAARGSNN